MSPPSAIQQWHITTPYVDLHCGLGEGPYYEPATSTLRFVDIKKKRIHTVSITAGPSSLTTLQLDERPTVTANVAGADPQQTLLVGLKYGIALLDRPAGRYTYLARFGATDNARLRANDGAADPHGRFWLGTMTDFGLGDFQPEGALYRFTPSEPATPPTAVRTGLTIPNSVGWSPDNRTMYFTHSSARTVFAASYDPATGELGEDERVFYQHDGPGEPDGFRVDVEGNVWHAVYGEAAVLKISPAGEVVGRVNLPTRNVTCVEFVGTELFVTTAGDEEGEGESKKYGGGLFRVEVGARGVGHFEVRV